MGFPFLTGFYSKDIILEFAYSRFVVDAAFIYFLSLMSAGFTAVYSIRALYFLFWGGLFLKTNIPYTNLKKFEKHVVECYETNMFISMLFLAIASIFIGYIFHDLMIGLGTDY